MSLTGDQQTAYVASGDPETDNPTTLQYPGLLGAKLSRTTSAGKKTYRLVKVAATSATLTASAAVFWADKSAFEVTATATNHGRCAGIARVAAAINTYCWVQTKGLGNVRFAAVPTSAPDATGKPVRPTAVATECDSVALGTALDNEIGRSAGTATAQIALVDIDIDDRP